MTFGQYLKKFKRDDTALGDFSRDWLSDFGEEKPTYLNIMWDDIIYYLHTKNASNNCIDIAFKAYMNYSKEMK